MHAVNHPGGKLERGESPLVLHAVASLVHHSLRVKVAVGPVAREIVHLAHGVLGGNVLHQKVRALTYFQWNESCG